MVSDRTVVTVAVLLVAVFFLVPLAMMVLVMPFAGPAHGAMGDGGWWLGTWLVSIAVLVGVAYALYALLGGTHDETDAALEELRLAYARGDLSEEEFERRRERLRREE